MTSFPNWLKNAVPALRRLDISHRGHILQLISATGVNPAEPLLTPEGWTEFGKGAAPVILWQTETAQRPLRRVIRLDRRNRSWPSALPTTILSALSRAGITSWSELGSFSPFQVIELLGAATVEELFAVLIARAASSAQPVADLLTHPEPALQAASTILDPHIDRQLEVWWSRNICLARPPTLAELGSRYGITGGRVQQIEATTRRRMNGVAALLKQGPLGLAARQLHSALGVAYPVDQLRWPALGLGQELASLPPDLGSQVGPRQAGMLLLWLAGPYRLERGWLTHDEIDVFTLVRQNVLSNMGDGYPSLADAENILSNLGVAPEVRLRLLQETGGLKVLDGQVCPWPADVPQRLEVVLRARGAPMPKSELATILQRNVGTIANILSTSNQFARVDLDHYGLTEWQGERYGGIVKAMQEAIHRRGGIASGQEISEDVLVRFNVSPASIKAYLTSNQFVRVEKNLYRTRGSTEQARASTRVSLEETGTCFFLNRGWALRLKVNEERLRGSGVGIPQAFANYIGLTPNGVLLIPVTTADGQRALGGIHFSWRAHVPTIGSVSHVVAELQLQLQDFLFLEWASEEGVIRADGTRFYQPTGLSEESVRSCIGTHIGRLTMAGAPSAVVLSSLSESLGLGPEAGRSAVIRRLQIRGDEELTKLSRVLYDLEAMRVEG